VGEAADLVSPMVADHHRRVAYLTREIGLALRIDEPSLNRAVLAAGLHDIGAFSLGERLRALEFDQQLIEHAEPGAALVQDFAPFAPLAPIIRHHHTEWQRGAGATHGEQPVPDEAHLVYVADRIAVLFDPRSKPLGQSAAIVDAIVGGREERFRPDVVDAFRAAADSEIIWLGLAADQSPLDAAPGETSIGRHEVDLGEFARMLAHVVDFRSPFTATHSSGVAAVAAALGGVTGLKEAQCDTLEVAGLLHDLGKLSVPNEVLEKGGPLNASEQRLVRAHSYYTGHILRSIPELAGLADLAAAHHEHPDGSGYPERLSGEQLAQDARVLAVGDVFTALTEDRPYRAALNKDRVMEILAGLAARNHVDAVVVEALGDGFGEIDLQRVAAQETARLRRAQVAATAASVAERAG
jgi:HD-GYP domain-containing protein (c-di-GMP phosphodiesterase class II)